MGGLLSSESWTEEFCHLCYDKKETLAIELLAVNSLPTHHDKNFERAVAWCCYQRLASVVGTVLGRIVGDVNVLDPEGMWLVGAAASGNLDIVNMLLEKGAGVAASDLSENTALHKASDFGHAKIVQALLAAGANPALPNREGKTAVQLAQRRKHESVVQLLSDVGESVAENEGRAMKNSKRRKSKRQNLLKMETGSGIGEVCGSSVTEDAERRGRAESEWDMIETSESACATTAAVSAKPAKLPQPHATTAAASATPAELPQPYETTAAASATATADVREELSVLKSSMRQVVERLDSRFDSLERTEPVATVAKDEEVEERVRKADVAEALEAENKKLRKEVAELKARNEELKRNLEKLI